MILQPPTKQEYDFKEKIRPDLQNEGFSTKEIEILASADSGRGAKGIFDLWKKNRKAPPEIENLKSEFGYQGSPFLTDLRAVAESQGTQLEGIIKARANSNFYIMRCGAYIVPNDEEKFEALKFEVSFKTANVSTYSMLPGPQTKKILELGGSADIGVTGKFDFGFPQIPLGQASVEAAAKAKLETNFVVSFHYELKSQVVDSFGMGNPFCRWFMHTGESLRNDVVFYPVIMTDKGIKSIDCEFKAFFKINHSEWENAEFFLKPPKKIAVSG
ncbi:MAG TPA: hypothetical protein VNX66_13590 [Candidatus Sulfotelmatobacter sp.]|jgi:hypothetical protein|nr:hypothetical protein [Candidatus Sulfotelmatobacter sp.]